MSAARRAPLFGETFEADCVVEVSHTFESLHALVEIDEDPTMYPGDRVRVHGAPINPPYGEVVRERRRATVVRASILGRLAARLRGQLGPLDLLDIRFTDLTDGSPT